MSVDISGALFVVILIQTISFYNLLGLKSKVSKKVVILTQTISFYNNNYLDSISGYWKVVILTQTISFYNNWGLN